MSSSTAKGSLRERMPAKKPPKRRHLRSSEPPAPSFTAAVLTVSDSCARGERVDLSGPAVARMLQKSGFRIAATQTVPDESVQIRNALTQLADAARLVVTTGGTGIAPRDVTPEATMAVSGRLLEGVAERMRFEGAKRTSFAALSRGVCGLRGTSLILNLPGSPKGAVESLQAVLDLIPHALNLLEGRSEHS